MTMRPPPAGRRPQVVVGVDDSHGAARAVGWAAHEAERRGAGLLLAHVHPTALAAPPGDGAVAPDALLRASGDLAAEVAPEVPVRASVLVGTTVEALVAESRGADLLVLGSAGRADVDHAAMGSVASRLATHADCPVVVVRDEPPRDPRGRVVAGVLDTPSGHAAAEVATREAGLRHAALVLVHADAPVGAGPGVAALAADIAARHPDLALDAHRVHADPVSALIEASGDADLLVLGCRHSTEHFDARLGPVPASILPRVHCPVMLVGAYPHHLRRRSPATPVRSEPTAH